MYPTVIKKQVETLPEVLLIFQTLNSVKAYTDDATFKLISTLLGVHASVLQQVDWKATKLDLSFEPSKCVSCLFDDYIHQQEGI